MCVRVSVHVLGCGCCPSAREIESFRNCYTRCFCCSFHGSSIPFVSLKDLFVVVGSERTQQFPASDWRAYIRFLVTVQHSCICLLLCCFSCIGLRSTVISTSGLASILHLVIRLSTIDFRFSCRAAGVRVWVSSQLPELCVRLQTHRYALAFVEQELFRCLAFLGSVLVVLARVRACV